MLIEAGCEVRGDDAVQRADARVKPATDEDWDTEYEDADHRRESRRRHR